MAQEFKKSWRTGKRFDCISYDELIENIDKENKHYLKLKEIRNGT